VGYLPEGLRERGRRRDPCRAPSATFWIPPNMRLTDRAVPRAEQRPGRAARRMSLPPPAARSARSWPPGQGAGTNRRQWPRSCTIIPQTAGTPVKQQSLQADVHLPASRQRRCDPCPRQSGRIPLDHLFGVQYAHAGAARHEPADAGRGYNTANTCLDQGDAPYRARPSGDSSALRRATT